MQEFSAISCFIKFFERSILSSLINVSKITFKKQFCEQCLGKHLKLTTKHWKRRCNLPEFEQIQQTYENHMMKNSLQKQTEIIVVCFYKPEKNTWARKVYSQNWPDLKRIRNDFERNKPSRKRNNNHQKWRGEDARPAIRDQSSWCESREIKSGNLNLKGSQDFCHFV